MTSNMMHILAGLFARSNMGMGAPEPYRITKLKSLSESHPITLDDAVVTFCEEFMEEDSHYDIFMAEGAMWVDMFKKDGEEKSRQNHPDMFALYDNA